MGKLRKLPIGIQDFESLRKDGYLYVDKTDILSCFQDIMEFKLDGTAEEALQQIKDKQYTLPFEMSGQKIICIGLNFDSKTRNIENYLIEDFFSIRNTARPPL